MAERAPLPLAGLRLALDALDDALLAIAAVRGRLVERAGRIKRQRALPLRSPERERVVRARARRLSRWMGLDAATAERLMAVLIEDACRRQRVDGAAADPRQGEAAESAGILWALRQPPIQAPMSSPAGPALLRLIPPPRRWAPVLHVVPHTALAQAFQTAARRVLAASLARGDLAALEGRVLGIEVLDLQLGFRVRIRQRCLQIDPLPADCPLTEARVRGSLTDLLLLASRLEDADTLFFQRRLGVSGDTELGLLARNLLDQLDWAQVPLPLRIVLNRAARLADSARAAWLARHADAGGANVLPAQRGAPG